MDRAGVRRTRAVVAVLLVLLAFGCGSASTTTPYLTAPHSGATAVPQPAVMECETVAFPCSFDEVADQVRAETERLVGEATTRVNDGATNDELVVWLDSEESVAEVEGDADAVRFRPVGGRGVWITRPSQPAPLPTGLPRATVAHAGVWDFDRKGGPTGETVTGEGRSQRRARVLSPFLWDFTESDDGRTVAERLRQLPEYANGVVYAENATISSTDVTVDDFRGWEDLQLVHLVSHGMRLCKLGKCRAVVAANVLSADATANIWGSNVRGLQLEVLAGPEPTYFALLDADFFRDEYPTGLGDTVVFLNGCATFGPGATDLADAIRGNRSVVLGWSRSVDSYGAQAASLAMYEELAGKGRTVGDALQQLGDLVNNSWLNINGDTVVTTLSSTSRALGGDLRIRDVVSFRDPAGGPLREGADVPLIGEPDDGAPDSVGWSLLVDGIEATDAAAAMVVVTIDGVAAPAMAVSSGAAEGTSSWRLQGTVALGVDVSAPQASQFEASLLLPEGGASQDMVAPVLVAESEPTPPGEPVTGSVWSGRATDRFEVQPNVFNVAEADLILSLDPETVGGRSIDYVATGGTLTFSVSGTTPEGCTHTLSPVKFPISPDMDIYSGALTIDTSTVPPTFRGSIHLSGGIVEVMLTCTAEYAYLNGPYSTRAQGIFIHVFSDEARSVVGDRISGTSAFGDRTFDISKVE